MSNGEKTLNIEPNIGGLLCYAPCCIGLLISIGVAILEKKNRFMRFHAFQSLLVHGAAFAVFLALAIAQMVGAMIFGPLALVIWGVEVLVGVAVLALMIFLMMKAYANEEYKLPTLGEQANKWV